jgi:hypothetical protein
MTIGIYAIYFEKLDKIYIGQSQSIEQRFIAHKSLFNKGHYNYKMAEAYSKDSSPYYQILLQCSIAELNANEVFYINEFNSIKEGLNLLHGGDAGVPGYYSGKCKNTREELELAFNLLTDTNLLKSDIISMSNVSSSVIDSIITGTRHMWLHEYYPEISKLVKANRYNRFQNAQENRYKIDVVLIFPDGLEVPCNNGAKLARQFNLNVGHLNAVIRGAELQHKGWKLKEGRQQNE